MNPDSVGVHPIANWQNPDRLADIVFIHGLRGGSHSTWCHGKEGRPDYFFWPVELGKDLPDCGIWSVGYPAGLTEFGNPGMIIEKRAGNISDKLAAAGLGHRPLFLITHSMGGLIAKSLIVESQFLPDFERKRLVSKVRGIVFCGTPHRGSELANAASVLGKFFGGSQKHVKQMHANAAPLDFLHDKFVEWHRTHPVPVDSYAENIGLLRKHWWCRPLRLKPVVSCTSANPNIAGQSTHDVDADHLALVKPPNRGHDVYSGVLGFIRRAVDRICIEAVAQPSLELPFGVVAMTREQSEQLAIPEVAREHMADEEEKKHYDEFVKRLANEDVELCQLSARYGSSPDDWIPFRSPPASDVSISKLITRRRGDFSRRRSSAPTTHNLPLVSLTEQLFAENPADSVATWRRLAQHGGMLIIDAISWFHPDIRKLLERHDIAETISSDRLAVLVICPFSLWCVGTNRLIEDKMRTLPHAFQRFDYELDPLCEVGGADMRSLRRWLAAALPNLEKTICGDDPNVASIAGFIASRKDAPQFQRLIFRERLARPEASS